VKVGPVTRKEVSSSQTIPQGLGNPGQDLEVTRTRHGLRDAGEDLVRIVTKLTRDVERFDSKVALQRKLLEQDGADTDASDKDRLDGQWERLSLEAAEMVTCSRQALERLRRLSEVTGPASH
jgi:hypothetical protein